MPLYELFCLAKPALAKPAVAEILRTAGNTIFQKGGIVTDVKSFGEIPLAYEIRKAGGIFKEVRNVLAKARLDVVQRMCAATATADLRVLCTNALTRRRICGS